MRRPDMKLFVIGSVVCGIMLFLGSNLQQFALAGNLDGSITEGEVVIVAQSCWTMIDAKTKRIAVNEKTYPDDFDYCDELPFGKKIIKISDFETSDVARSLEPRFSDLDYNGHVNNAKYADFVLDTLVPREGIKLKSFQIDYHKEIKPEETVLLHAFSEGDNVKLKGIGDDGAVRFIAEVGYEK